MCQPPYIKQRACRFLLAALLSITQMSGLQAQPQPNMLFIYIDDMGYGDLSCYGNTDIATPNIDRLAREGLQFTQFYVSSPVCSPSRAGALTGQYPARHQIYGYLASRWENEQRHMPDWLDPAAPTIARTLHKAGYATAHIGKWHLGGGFDISKAPPPTAYGYDESLVAFSGMGKRVLVRGPELDAASAKLGGGPITWVDHDYQKNRLYVDSVIAFIQQHQDRPFYTALWFNAVHDPFDPNPALMKKLRRFARDPYKQQYYAAILEMDQQIGRLLDWLDQSGLAANTLVFLASDNGPTDWPRYYRGHDHPPGSAGLFRGRKWSLYEGGIREPLLVRWPGHVPAGVVDSTSIICNIDFLPTLAALAGAPLPEAPLDGENMAAAWLGRPQKRDHLLKWVFGFNPHFIAPGNPRYRSPALAIRDGQWKVLVNPDGSQLALYDLEKDLAESENISNQYPEIARRLAEKARHWWAAMPKKKDGPDRPTSRPIHSAETGTTTKR